MKKTDGQAAKNALINILVFPGLGSLRSGRRLAGAGQVFLVMTGTVMGLIWFFKVLSQYYGQMFGDVEPKPVGWIGVVGGILFCSSWLWAGVTSFSLFREASRTNRAPPALVPAPPRIFPTAKKKLVEAAIPAALASIPQWQRLGETISRTFQFTDFPAAIKFVNAVAEAAEAAHHHPAVDIRWNQVTLALSTHDAGGLTEKDFSLARQCDALAAG